MLLTNPERDFLAGFIHEATTDPFRGPATEDLHRHNIDYTDISHLMAAYYYLVQAGNQEKVGGNTSRRRLRALGTTKMQRYAATKK